MRHEFAQEFGSKVSYKVPLSSNVLQMPSSLVDNICSPADICQLHKKDYMDFYRQLKDWSIKNDQYNPLTKWQK